MLSIEIFIVIIIDFHAVTGNHTDIYYALCSTFNDSFWKLLWYIHKQDIKIDVVYPPYSDLTHSPSAHGQIFVYDAVRIWLGENPCSSTPWKATSDSLCSWVPATHMGYSDLVLDSWLQPGPASTVANTWEVSQRLEKMILFLPFI